MTGLITTVTHHYIDISYTDRDNLHERKLTTALGLELHWLVLWQFGITGLILLSLIVTVCLLISCQGSVVPQADSRFVRVCMYVSMLLNVSGAVSQKWLNVFLTHFAAWLPLRSSWCTSFLCYLFSLICLIFYFGISVGNRLLDFLHFFIVCAF